MIRPGSEAELAEAIRDADAPLSLRGGGTRGPLPEGTAITTSGLTGIVLHDPAALTLVVRAGTPVDEIDAALAGANQCLAFEPMDHRALLGSTGTPTIGGVVAANVSGPRRVLVGAARDHLLGLRFVDGEGSVIKNGGRVMKNVTGYDLARLLAGSRGALGAITEVALKVLPGTETCANLVAHGLDDAAAVRAMSAALGTPYEVTGAAHDPHAAEGPRTVLRIEGFAPSVAYRSRALVEALRPHGTWQIEDDREAVRAEWRGIRDVAPFHGTTGNVWRVSVRPSEAADLAARAGADQVFYDWGGGLVWLRLPEGCDLRARLGRYDGHATLVRAAPETHAALHRLQPEPPALQALSRGLREKFDPRGILAA
ncbi:FAD-binding protein [Limimaricola litoreus]|uniref:FAD-binding protein n=1 Tax=Limimaricola litoreus TaxID=2955316 RepID=A0A9X2FX34_9RHOB|nr:FAD-binding protein [Limimaricola litoreus]MCP1168753.1 FAD-binding protein [Limimaricola litoreus]